MIDGEGQPRSPGLLDAILAVVVLIALIALIALTTVVDYGIRFSYLTLIGAAAAISRAEADAKAAAA